MSDLTSGSARGGLGTDDRTLTELLGPKCPACGWRNGHRAAAGTLLPACPEA